MPCTGRVIEFLMSDHYTAHQCVQHFWISKGFWLIRSLPFAKIIPIEYESWCAAVV